MKKVLSVLCMVAVSASVHAALTGQVNLSMTQTLLYNGAVAAPAGWYVEAILSATSDPYNSALFTTVSDYIVVGEDYGVYHVDRPYHQVGKTSTGGTLADGRVGMSYQFGDLTRDNYYITLRFYNGTDKNTATKYGVIPTWKQVTVNPNDPTAAQS